MIESTKKTGSVELTSSQKKAISAADDLRQEIEKHSNIVQWLCRNNAHMSQRGIANFLVSRRDGDEDEIRVPNYVDHFVHESVVLNRASTSREIVRVAIHKLLQHHLPEVEHQKNVRHHKKMGNERRKIVRRKRSEQELPDQELLHLFQTLEEQVPGKPLAFVDISRAVQDGEDDDRKVYHRTKRRIYRMRSYLQEVALPEPCADPSAFEPITRLHLLRAFCSKFARQDGEIQYDFLERELQTSAGIKPDTPKIRTKMNNAFLYFHECLFPEDYEYT